VQDRNLGEEGNVKCLIGTRKAEQSVNISVMLFLHTFLLYKMYLICVSMYLNQLLHLSLSLLCNFILHVKYCFRISGCLKFSILDGNLDLVMKNTQLCLPANTWVISLLASKIKGWITELWLFSTDA